MIEHIELLISFFIASILLAVYGVYALLTDPSGGHPIGQLMGIFGLLLMLMTETLYAFRKRVPWFRFGPLRLWLSFHIITGIVGPWLALLHTAFVFRGLAGLAMALTILVVISGFVGRYIYTAVPRTIVGATVARNDLAAQVVVLQAELDHWAATQTDHVQALVAHYQVITPRIEVSSLGLLTRFLSEWQAKRQLRRTLWTLEQVEQQKLRELERLLRHRQELERQIASLKTAQQLLRWWHRLHVPLGLTLFTVIAIHIGATIYFGGLVR